MKKKINQNRQCLFWNNTYQTFAVLRIRETAKTFWYFLDDSEYLYKQVKTKSNEWDFWSWL